MKKIKLNTLPYIYKINNVNNIRVNLLYPVEIEPRYTDVYKLHLMNSMLRNSSKVYNEVGLLKKALNKNLVIKYQVGYIRFDNELFISINFVVPKEGLIESFNLDNAFKLLYEIIYNPDACNKEFNNDNFIWHKDSMLNNLKQEINNIYDLAIEEMDNFFDPDNKHFIHRQERIELLEKTNPKNVYEYYEKNVKNNKFISFIYGAIDDKEKVLKSFNKYFKQDYYQFNIDVELYRLVPYTDYQEKKVDTKYNQSVVYQIYQVENIKEKDDNIMNMLYYFLYSRENRLIFDTLRNKHNLVYECSVEYDNVHGLMYIRALMDKKDRKLINKLIKDTVYSIADEKVFNRCKANLMKSLEYDLLDDEDDDFHDVVSKIYKMIKYNVDIEYIIKHMEKIDYKQMKEFLSRFKLSRNLFMEGGHYE